MIDIENVSTYWGLFRLNIFVDWSRLTDIITTCSRGFPFVFPFFLSKENLKQKKKILLFLARDNSYLKREREKIEKN